jgi:hypothetical protein
VSRPVGNYLSQPEFAGSPQGLLMCPRCDDEFDTMTGLMGHLRDGHAPGSRRTKFYADDSADGSDTLTNRVAKALTGGASAAGAAVESDPNYAWPCHCIRKGRRTSFANEETLAKHAFNAHAELIEGAERLEDGLYLHGRLIQIMFRKPGAPTTSRYATEPAAADTGDPTTPPPAAAPGPEAVMTPPPPARRRPRAGRKAAPKAEEAPTPEPEAEEAPAEEAPVLLGIYTPVEEPPPAVPLPPASERADMAAVIAREAADDPDPELDTAKVVLRILEPLGASERKRILEYLACRLVVDVDESKGDAIARE